MAEKLSKLNVIVITGVTKGLGKALAKQFLQCGVKVVGCARNITDSDFQHENLSIDIVDVTSALSMKQWARKTVIEHGIPDVVLQSAGTVNASADIENISGQRAGWCSKSLRFGSGRWHSNRYAQRVFALLLPSCAQARRLGSMCIRLYPENMAEPARRVQLNRRFI